MFRHRLHPLAVRAWLLGYPEIQRHISIRSTGYVAAIPSALSILGAAGGVFGAAPFTICATEVDSNPVAVVCVTLAMMFGALCAGLFRALASVIGLMSSLCYLLLIRDEPIAFSLRDPLMPLA